MSRLEKRGKCIFLHMKNGKNLLTQEFMVQINEALDEALKCEDAKCLITIGEGKYYCAGVGYAAINSSVFTDVAYLLQKLLARLITFPMVTVAAMNGHAIGGGGFLALAHDYRIMCDDRAVFSLPAAKFKRTVPIGLMDLVKSKVPQPELHILMTTAKFYTASEAKACGIVNQVAKLENIKDCTIEFASTFIGKELNRKTLASIKSSMHYELCQELNEPCRFISAL